MGNRADAARRLTIARGHLDAVIRMVDEQRYCIDVLHQLSAVQGALEHARRELLAGHLRRCVPAAVRAGRTDDIVEELLATMFGAPPRGSRATKERPVSTETTNERKPDMTKLLDPVCGMQVDDTALRAEGYDAYAFCSPGCRKAFLADPERFLAGASEDAEHEGHHHMTAEHGHGGCCGGHGHHAAEPAA